MIDLKKKKFLLIIIAAVLLLCIVSVILIIFIPKTDEIKYQIVYDGVKGTGVVFRDEEYFSLSSYEKIYYNNIIDGQYVSAGTQIASAYKKGYIKATFEKLIDTEKNIVTYQNQNIITAFDDKTIQNYDFEIDVIIKKMSQNEGRYIELHGQLCRLISERQNYIRKNYNTENNDYLQKLYVDEFNMTESLAQWCDEFNASNDGFVGFYCDGAEKDLSIKKAQKISFEDYEEFLKEDYSIERSGFKIVNDATWYVTLRVDDSDMFEKGNYYTVYIGNEAQGETGLLERVVEENKGNILVFSFNDNVEKYLDVRITDVFVGQRKEGFSVNRQCVKYGKVTTEDDKSISVNVLYENGDIVLFEATDELKVGQKVYR